MRNFYFKYSLLFIASLALAIVLSSFISLPFHNSLQIHSRLSSLGYNPLNNHLVTSLIIFLPCLVLLLSGRIIRGNLSALSSKWLTKLSVVSDNRPNYRAFFAFVICCGIVSLNIPSPYSAIKVDQIHEGEVLANSISYLADKKPYSEIAVVHGLYHSIYKGVLAFEIFGQSIGALRSLESVHKFISYMLFGFLLARLFNYRYHLYLPAFLLIISLSGFRNFLPPVGLIGRDLPILILLILFCRPPESVIATFLSAFLTAISFLYAVDKAIYAFVIFIAALAMMCLQRRQDIFRHLTYAAVGLLSGLFIIAWILGNHFYIALDFTINLLSYKDLLESDIYPLHKLNYLSLLIIVSASYYFLTSILLAERTTASFKDRLAHFCTHNFCEIILALTSFLYLRNVINRPDMAHLEYSTFPAYLLLIRLTFPLLTANKTFEKNVGLCSCLILVFLAAVTALRLGSANLLRNNFPLQISDQELVDPINQTTFAFVKSLPEDDQFFVFTSDPSLYYFAEQPPPSRFAIPWIAGPVSLQQEIIADLRTQKVKYVIFNKRPEVAELDHIKLTERLPVLHNYIVNEYKFFQDLESAVVYYRK